MEYFDNKAFINLQFQQNQKFKEQLILFFYKL